MVLDEDKKMYSVSKSPQSPSVLWGNNGNYKQAEKKRFRKTDRADWGGRNSTFFSIGEKKKSN